MWQPELIPDHEAMGGATVLLDVTRLVALRWSERPPNGIDRVCLAYLRHFGHRARAVVQHRGAIGVMDRAASRRLFEQLAEDRSGSTRARLLPLLAGALASPRKAPPNSLYLNVSHTDFDLSAHARWVERHAVRAVYLVHDLIPILHPQHCRPHAVARHACRVAAALRHGSGIIVGTAAVERDLRDHAERFGFAQPPVLRAPLAGAELRRDLAPLHGVGDYFLCVGTIESRKNHILLLRVWERIRSRLGAAAPRLVIVGKWGRGVAGLREALASSKMAGGLIDVIEDCGDEHLARLMAGARAVLMPTLAEGFGLPMAEALALGLPVIASNLPCFHEVGQGIPRLLDPQDLDGWEARIVALDQSAARRQRRIDALHGYRAPTWNQHFDLIDAWLTTIAAAPDRARAMSFRASRALRPARLGQQPISGA